MKRLVVWVGLLLIVALTVLSIVGAFLGTERAKELFNSPALVFFWVAITVLLTGGMLVFGRLRREAGLLLIHAGCVLVLVGGMYGSQAGHQLLREYFGSAGVPHGYMAIFEGQSENRIMTVEQINMMFRDLKKQRQTSPDDQSYLEKLPFHVRLHDFRIEYYRDKGKLLIYTQKRPAEQMKALEGEEFDMGPELPRIRILRTFRNFRINIKDGKRQVSDDIGKGENPAIEVEISRPNGKTEKKYIFERFPDFNVLGDGQLQMRYVLMPKDYFSDLEVEDGQAGTLRTIEVNKPLHYGGYYFYQSDYDHESGRYTILSVRSDTGLIVVFAGYFLLCAGIFWHFWFRNIIVGWARGPRND
jgi:ResB-like family